VRWAQQYGIKNLYYYQFGQIPPCFWPSSQSFCCNSCCHGDEIPYVFHDTGSPYPWNLTGSDLIVADATSAYWASFAGTLNPNTNRWPGTPVWPVYRAHTDQSLSILDPISVVTGLNSKNCDFWDTIGYEHKKRIAPALKRILDESRKKKK